LNKSGRNPQKKEKKRNEKKKRKEEEKRLKQDRELLSAKYFKDKVGSECSPHKINNSK
jgi:hypothetical protein